MKITTFLLAFVAFFGLFSCSPTLSPFTRKLYETTNLSEENLKKVQFFLSDDLILTRDAEEAGSAQVLGGKIKMENGRKVEVIKFRAGTPGVFLFRPQDDHFAVSFESGDDTRFLIFGPNPKQDGRYILLASEWQNRRGKVTYAGEKFRTNTEAAYLTLMVDLKHIQNYEVENRRAKGRRVE
jgi:hypothetical protein